MNTYPLTVSTPDGRAFSGEVSGLILRAAEGDIAILPGHIPLMTTVQPGLCRILLPDAPEKAAHLTGGLLTVGRDRVILMAENWEERA
ncbi:MAG: hypothetical protein IKP40_11090 [Clostridia bacterium]|nr:hypothetical protein [Clostridia bacterium]